MQQLRHHTLDTRLKRFVLLENKITRKSEDPDTIPSFYEILA